MPDTAPPPQSIPSSYTWGRLLDMQRRLGGSQISFSGQDQLDIINQVSSVAYEKYMWPFTLETTVPGQIPCVNGVQDYACPDNLRALSRAWFRVPTINTAIDDGTVPPYDDPSYEAYIAAQLSAQYVANLGNGGGTPAAYIYPGSGSMDVVKRLPVNLNMWGYTSIRQIAQQPNQQLLRLAAATAVNSNQPYFLELEYQPVRPPVASLAEPCWFPDSYIAIGQAGLLYFIYAYGNDPRAGSVSYNPAGTPTYSGQYAVWMNAMEGAAAAERNGSVNNFVPEQSLGGDWGNYGGAWFA